MYRSILRGSCVDYRILRRLCVECASKLRSTTARTYIPVRGSFGYALEIEGLVPVSDAARQYERRSFWRKRRCDTPKPSAAAPPGAPRGRDCPPGSVGVEFPYLPGGRAGRTYIPRRVRNLPPHRRTRTSGRESDSLSGPSAAVHPHAPTARPDGTAC